MTIVACRADADDNNEWFVAATTLSNSGFDHGVM